MHKVFNFLYMLVNRFGFPLISALIILGTGLFFSRDGFSPAELLILAVLIVAASVIWALAHARQSANVPDESSALFEQIHNSGKYAMLAFESEFCISSTTVGHRLAALEATYPDTFQLYSLSIFKTPGKELFEEYKGRATPTFVLVDPDGKMVMNWPLILPIDHVNYEINRKRPVPAQSG